MKKIITKDKSITFYSKKYKETYHSVSGAEEEAVKKFVEPSNIKKLAKNKKQIKILDVCFGIGYNSAAAIDAIKAANPKCKILIIGLENDRKILKKINKINSSFKSYNHIKQASEKLKFKEKNIEIKILLGDAREKIKTIKRKFDAVFLDPFSPKKCPELWTEEFFKKINKLMKKGSILTTYSCAKIVRKNLAKTGFKVKDGPIIGRRAPSTIAVKR
jgi:tRNA U34 5-methylaminomethyl-2-thiouridine-forming methyltransferase MnmC